MSVRSLPDDITVLAGTDVKGEWERFEVFEALHHRMRICNPMSATDLAMVVALLDPRDGEKALDIACGHGELLIQLAERAAVAGHGVDLSPWALQRAEAEAATRGVAGNLQWMLGNAQGLDKTSHDIVTCLGASWIWHGFAGTVRAMADRLADGGRIAIGDLRLRDDVEPSAITATFGTVLRAETQADLVEQAGFEIIERIDPPDRAWDAYQERIQVSAETWAAEHPGEKADGYVQEQMQWRREHDRDMAFLRWSVWVARRP